MRSREPVMFTCAGSGEPRSKANVVIPPTRALFSETWIGHGLDQSASSFPSQSLARAVRWISAAAAMRWQFSGVVPVTSKFLIFASGAGTSSGGWAMAPNPVSATVAAVMTATFTVLKIIVIYSPVALLALTIHTRGLANANRQLRAIHLPVASFQLLQICQRFVHRANVGAGNTAGG